jgi:mannosylglycerate hydrolase
VWRGVPMSITRDTFRWAAPDGSEVQTEYLVGGYGNGASLFDVPDRVGPKLAGYVADSTAFYGDRSILAMYGEDHAVPSAQLTDLVDAVNLDRDDLEVRLETLADYVARPDIDERPPQHWVGELRSGARANMLMGVSSARIDVKAAAGRVERLLERYAEPLTALHGGAWPDRLLELAWRRVVDNSAHDSICGCSHDAVVTQVLSRFAEAEQLGRGVLEATSRQIASTVPFGDWAVVNPSPRERRGLVALDVAMLDGEGLRFVADGRPAAFQVRSRKDPVVARIRLRGDAVRELIARRRHGRELFGRQLNGSRIDANDDPPSITLLVDDIGDPPELDVDELVDGVVAAAEAAPAELWELLVLAPDRAEVLVQVAAPALGWSTVEATTTESGEAEIPVGVDDPPVTVGDRSMSNGLVTITVNDDGTVDLSGGGSQLRGIGRLVDGGDFGDSYNYGPPANDLVVEDPDAASVSIRAAGPLLGELVIDRRYRWPVDVEPTGVARTAATVDTAVTTRLELRAGEPFVRVAIEFENRARQHRLRWHSPLPAPVTTSSAEGQFAVVERGLTMEGGHGEEPLPTYPAHGFVHATGVSLLLDHLTEYELVDDGRELAITVLRAFGLISRNANPYREDPAGPEIPVPDAQRIGPCRFSFAVMPHAKDWPEAGVLRAMEQYRNPLFAVRGTARELASGQGAVHGLSVDGPGVVLSTLRRRGEWLELRLVAEHPTATEASVRGSFREAVDVDLLGRLGASRSVSDGSLHLPLGAWEIATVRLR